MNENQEYNSGVVKPYKATANLNIAIGNPSVNINNTMDVNIQNIKTNTGVPSSINNNISNTNLNVVDTNVSNIVNKTTIHDNTNNNQQNVINSDNSQNKANLSSDYVTKTYVTVDNKPKKKKLTFNLGSEFKMALLIIVILLVFVFILPIISEIIFGY